MRENFDKIHFCHHIAVEFLAADLVFKFKNKVFYNACIRIFSVNAVFKIFTAVEKYADKIFVGKHFVRPQNARFKVDVYKVEFFVAVNIGYAVRFVTAEQKNVAFFKFVSCLLYTSRCV